jgi:hypothetical protein
MKCDILRIMYRLCLSEAVDPGREASARQYGRFPRVARGAASAVAVVLAIAWWAPSPSRAPAGREDPARGARRDDAAWQSTVEVLESGARTVRLRFELERLAARATPPGRAQAGDPACVSYRRPRNGGDGAWRAAAGDEAAFTVLVRIRDTGAVDATVENVVAEPTGDPWPVHDGSAFATDPAPLIEVGTPAIMRDLRVVPVTFRPFAHREQNTVARSLDLALEISDGPGENEKRGALPSVSPAFRRLYASRVLNYSDDLPEDAPGAGRGPLPLGARYLVITYDSFESGVRPLVDWKHKKGIEAKLVRLSDVGSSPLEIRNYIATAYDTWEVPPEYVLLVGDTEVLPSYDGLTSTDNYYAAIEGSDYLADIMVGRISADSPGHVATQVAKILGYERTPVEGDPNWPASAALMVADDFDDGDWIYYTNTWFIYDLMDASGFAPIDTLFRRNPLSTQDVYDSVNAGRGFLNYRGQAWYNWLYEFDIDPYQTTNGWKLPVVVSATCATGIFYTDGFVCEDWVRAGTAENPRGGVAFFATNTAIMSSPELSLRRGYVDEGFFANAFDEGGLTLGEACLAGKLNLYNEDENQLDYEGWNLLGDPAMNLWTAVPSDLNVSHTSTLTIGPSDLTVFVTSARGPVEGALVGCAKGAEVYAWGVTDAAGRAVVSVAPASAGTLSVTVTARNGLPYEGSVQVIDSGPLLVYAGLSIDDTGGGNGDGLLSPGEAAAISVGVGNIGDETAASPVVTFRTRDDHATVIDSVAAYADVPPDSVVWSPDVYTLSVDSACPVGHALAYSLAMAYGGTVRVQSPPPIDIATGRLRFPQMTVGDGAPGGDGDGAPDPGETIALVVTLTNEGPCDLTSVEGVLATADPLVAVMLDHATFGDAPSGGTASNDGLPFILSISPGAPAEHEVALSLRLAADGHSYTYADTLQVALAVVGAPSTLPTGPDAHGYYAYDAGDSLHGPAPVFDWVELAPPGPGTIIAEITDADAAVTSVPIFFSFKYYGRTYTQISVCSNGFVSMGVTDYRLGDNSAIPSGHGPPNMIAPFWDDLDPSAGGDVYKWFDATNHRFIVEFDQVRHWASPDAETFEVILLDPGHYPTPTGDGMILMQYKTVEQANGCTVGIEDHVALDGIEYLYNGSYGEHAVPLIDGTALLFTTHEPEAGDRPWLVLGEVTLDDAAGGNGNGVAEPGETISLVLELTNGGAVDAADVGVIASSPEDAVWFADSTAAFPDIPAGASADNSTDALVFSVSEAPSDTVATIWAAVEANGGDYAGAVRYDLHISMPAAGLPEDGRPLAFGLSPCRPNPFSSVTSLRLALPEPRHVSIRVYNLSGRLVRTLVDGPLRGGEHFLCWDGLDALGLRVGSGIYFIRAEAGPRRAREKVVLLR